MITWKNEYATGVTRIDEQHKWLFNFVNELEMTLEEDEGSVEVTRVLEKLGDYARRHFEYEENCMARWKCPFAQENKCAHGKFIKAYKDFMQRYERDGDSPDLAWRIQRVCETWIIDHICRIDLQLRKVADPGENKAGTG